MKRFSGLALVSASLLSLPVHAAAPDPAPTVVTDAQGTTLTGAHHLDGAAFSLIVTDWWLSGTIANGQAQDIRLIVEVHLPQYPLLDRATDAVGRPLDVVILHRGPSARWSKKASERVAVVLPGDVAEKARTAGLAVTVTGKGRSFPIAVPGPAIAAFLDRYRTVAASGAAPVPAAATPAPPAPAPIPVPAPKPQAAPPAPAAQPPVAPKPPVQAPPPAAAPDDDDPAITPLADKRVHLPDGGFAPAPAPSPAPAPQAAPEVPPAPARPLVSLPGSASFKAQPATPDPDDGTNASGGHGIWVGSLGLQFVPTSSGAMVLLTKPGSIAAAKGIEGGDFIEAVDGVSIKALDGPQMAARIGAPGVKVLQMIAVGNVKIR